MTNEQIFEYVSEKITNLCIEADIEVPVISLAHADDPCDVTGFQFIRLNIDAYDGADYELYAYHVFAHYMCDAHCLSCMNEDRYADNVADFVASLIYLTRYRCHEDKYK